MKKLKTIPNKSLLVIEGLPETRKLLKGLLENSGANVHMAGTVEEGFDYLANHSPHLILLDLELPQDGVWKFLREKLQDNTIKDIPVVIMGESHDKQTIAQAISLGAVDAVVKPFDSKALIGKIVTHTKNHKFLSFQFNGSDIDLISTLTMPAELIKLSPANAYVEVPGKLSPNEKIKIRSKVLEGLGLSDIRLKTTAHPPTNVSPGRYICSIKFAGLSNREAIALRKKMSQLKAS